MPREAPSSFNELFFVFSVSEGLILIGKPTKVYLREPGGIGTRAGFSYSAYGKENQTGDWTFLRFVLDVSLPSWKGKNLGPATRSDHLDQLREIGRQMGPL